MRGGGRRVGMRKVEQQVQEEGPQERSWVGELGRKNRELGDGRVLVIWGSGGWEGGRWEGTGAGWSGRREIGGGGCGGYASTYLETAHRVHTYPRPSQRGRRSRGRGRGGGTSLRVCAGVEVGGYER